MKSETILNRLKFSEWSMIKKIIIAVMCTIFIITLIVIATIKQNKNNSTASKVSWVHHENVPKKELNYEFIKLDTIEISHLPSNKKKIEPEIKTENKMQPEKKTAPIVQKKSTSPIVKAVNKNPNMIVMNKIQDKSVESSSGSMAFKGMKSALVKLVIPNRTPVASGSLVEARVLKDSNWGEITIPKRTKLIGVASLFNRRINIDFREIIINDVSRSCSGRVYDIRNLQGISYSPVSSETKRALLEELRDSVTGVPVVNRMANRATFSNNYTQDVSVLDEGLECYAYITSIF